MNAADVVEYSEHIQQPKDHDDHHHDIEDVFDLPVHGDVGVDEPEQDANDDESYDDCY